MKYFEVVFNSIPFVAFAHRYQTQDYEMGFPVMHRKLELSYIEYGDLTFFYEDGTSEVHKENTICLGGLSQPAGHGKSSGRPHCHMTAAFNADMDFREVQSDEIIEIFRHIQPQNNLFRAIIPKVIDNPEEVKKVREMIRKIVTLKSELANTLKLASCSFELLYEVTKYSFNCCIDELQNSAMFSGSLYCRKAISYISQNINSRLTTSDIAEALGLSREHMCRIFKSVTGLTVLEYINKLKIDTAKEYLQSKDMSLGEISKIIGISNEKYFSRLFKKQTGMTVGEYKRLINDSAPEKDYTEQKQ